VQIELAVRLQMCDAATHRRLAMRVERVGRMLNGLISTLRSDQDEE
jgi:hypothetical protein